MAKMGTVWDRTSEFLGDRLGAVLPVAVLGFFLPTVINQNLTELTRTAALGIRFGAMAVVLLLSVVSLWGTLTVVAMAVADDSAALAGARARARLPVVLLVSIVLGVATMLCLVPLLLLAGVDSAALLAGHATVPTQQAAARAGLYFLVLLVVAMLLFPRLAVMSPVMLEERLGFGALRRSWHLTRRHGLRILGVFLLFAIVTTVAQWAAQIVFGSVFKLLLGETASGLPLATILTSVVVAAVQSFFALLIAAFQGKLYRALVDERGEGRFA